MSSPIYRAPFQQQIIPSFEQKQEENKIPRTRCGYLVPEAYSTYEGSLGETGPVAKGKAIHFAADLICSGGLDIWIRGIYSYCIQHIGIASPRIFVYLRDKIQILDKKVETLPQEAFYSHPDVQASIGEAVLIVQLCPKRNKIVWPKVDQSTHRTGWIRGVAGAPEKGVTRKVWSSNGDSPTLYLVANEFCKAIEDGSSEKALFWLKWVLEEDALIKKETKSSGLTTIERAPADIQGKARTDVGHYMAQILVELYKELASKGLIRMNEEFQELWRLWRGGEKRMASRLKKECLGWITLVCCEVPRWKVPAAPSLVEDPIQLSRAVGQVGTFFKEVLSYKPLASGKELKPNMMKMAREKKKNPLTEAEKQKASLGEHLDAYDAIMESYLKDF